MKKEMLINVLQPEECRIAIVEDGILEELYVERTSHESYTGNIYKGKIVNLEPAIQAAFVDFSVGRNGFLHVSDVEPQYYRRHAEDADDAVPAERPRRERGEERGERGDRPPRGRGDRDRDRPDRSEKGRRDRSERRFGEGLVEDWEAPPPPPPKPVASAPPPAPSIAPPQVPSLEPPAPRAEEPRAESRSAPDFDELIGWERPRREPKTRDRTPPPVPSTPAEPRARAERPAFAPEPPEEDSAEANLPPSRTQRSRPSRSVEPEPSFLAGDDEEEIPSFRPRRPAGARPVEPEEEVESFRPRTPSARTEPEEEEPRRGWGRGRGRAEAPAPRPEPEDEPDVFAPEPMIDEEESPRRRGRSAIRARGGGEREPERPRPREREVARSRDFDVEEPIEAEDLSPVRADEPEPVREPRTRGRRERDRDRTRPTEPETARPAPHDRAGEPGYVPRHKRQTAGDLTDPFAPAARRDLDEDDLLGEEIETETEGEGEAGEAGREGGRRRRRRRGRRRDRPEREAEAKAAPEAEAEDEIEEADEFDDLDEPAPAPARPARRERGRDRDREAPSFRREREPEPSHGRDDFDFGDEDEEDEELVGRSAVEPEIEEEIDPELEEEIRREIEEIAELELEMGLRATTEARPRRGDVAAGGRAPRGRGLTKPPLQEIFRRGDEVLVQVIKESIGTKGPTLSTYISIPGRYLVLMPGLNRVGVSRKIADEGQRRRLREIMNALNPPKGLGFIVRTAGLDRTKKELARDLAYLLRLWKVILRRIKKAKAPAPIYQESDMITRTIRDIFNAEIDTIWIDEPAAFERAQEFLRVVMPKFVNRLKLYEDKVPLFHKYGLEEEIVKIQRRRVEMPEGGSIVIDQTEALVAIDVNSGNFRVENDAEKTAYEMNLRAAKEIARQLRLRDLGGVICNDFIDMRDEKHRRGVEKALRDAIKRDRARTKVLRMSQFGIIEMTRQRIRPSLKRSVYEDCPECSGAGVVKTVESMSIDVMRLLALASNREDIRRVNVSVSPDVATYLNNRKRKEISKFEAESGVMIYIHPEPDAAREHLQLDCFDAQNGEVRLLPAPTPPPRRGR